MQPNTSRNDEEVWRLVPSYPELLASSWGRVLRRPHQKQMPYGGLRWYRSKPTYGVRVHTSGLAGFRMAIGYRGVGRNLRVARLVCEAFHGKAPTPKHVVMHLDDDPGNNRPENLRWGTQKENLNAPQFLEYCRSRTGANNPRVKGQAAIGRMQP